MAIATVTSKGQVTIPVEVRRALGLHTGDRIQFTAAADGVFELRAATRPVVVLRGALAHRAPAEPVSLEEIDRALEREAGAANR